MIFNIDSITELTSLQVQSAPKVTNGFIVHSPVEFAVFLKNKFTQLDLFFLSEVKSKLCLAEHLIAFL